jgi:hypothetical protein
MVTTPLLTCPGCGKPFEPVRPRQRHCRPTCQARAQYRDAAPRLPLLDRGAVLTTELPPARPRGRGEV